MKKLKIYKHVFIPIYIWAVLSVRIVIGSQLRSVGYIISTGNFLEIFEMFVLKAQEKFCGLEWLNLSFYPAAFSKFDSK